MEANFFRHLVRELTDALTSLRIEKIFRPAPDTWTFKVQSSGGSNHLLFRPAKSAGLLFLSATKPANPASAPAEAMWFRKRISGRRILELSAHWPSLRLILELSPRKENDPGRYLLLDMRNGLELLQETPDNFHETAEWPSVEDVMDDPDIWRNYPQISPKLRDHLRSCPLDQMHFEYMKIATGQIDGFFLPFKKEIPQAPLAWKPKGKYEEFDSALVAAGKFGEQTLFQHLEMEDDKDARILLKRERKRVNRNIQRLEDEAIRLDKLKDNQILAEALQAELYRIKHLDNLEEIEITHPTQGLMTVPLNPHLTPAENMVKYFKLAAKGERGMAHVARRRRELEEELVNLEKGKLPERALYYHEKPEKMAQTALPQKFRGLDVHKFTSSDGFVIIRGKNKKANHAMLSKAASSFDYWMHAEGGPSSHIILKRDHPNQEIPERTLREAAILCGLKSFKSSDGRADIMYALVKDVRKVKGFAHGSVMVDSVLGVVRVDLDESLERKLT